MDDCVVADLAHNLKAAAEYPHAQHIRSAAGLLAKLRLLFDHVVTCLALECAVDGKLQVDLADGAQIASFELAWAATNLLAVENVVAGLDTRSHELDQRLALIFYVEAIANVLSRLEGLYLKLGLNMAPLHALAVGPAWFLLRQQGAGAAALEAAGRALNSSAAANVSRWFA